MSKLEKSLLIAIAIINCLSIVLKMIEMWNVQHTADLISEIGAILLICIIVPVFIYKMDKGDNA